MVLGTKAMKTSFASYSYSPLRDQKIPEITVKPIEPADLEAGDQIALQNQYAQSDSSGRFWSLADSRAEIVLILGIIAVSAVGCVVIALTYGYARFDFDVSDYYDTLD